jgi:hypothetical protein
MLKIFFPGGDSLVSPTLFTAIENNNSIKNYNDSAD